MTARCNSFSVFGLGKLGASMAAAIASRGYHVIGVDVNRSAVTAINEGRAPVQETHLDQLIGSNRDRLRATMSPREAIMNSDLSFVIVPTPSDDRGAFSLQYASAVCREIGRALREKNTYHNVVMTSTVLPGATRFGLLPLLETESGKRCGPDFGVCYSPEFIALGSVIRDFLNPDFNLIGEVDDRAGQELEECYSRIVTNGATSRRMSVENAELTKLALNAYVTTKVTFANTLAALCERMPGGDVDVVTGALGMDKRIGPRYLVGGLGYGGPCFPRDNAALAFFSGRMGNRADLAETTDRVNRSLPVRVVELLRPRLKRNSTVALLGLAYKPHSHVIEESQSLYIARGLAGLGVRIVAYDPLANEMARAELGGAAIVLDSMKECLSQADAVIVATPDPAFKALRSIDLPERAGGLTVVDCWRLLNPELCRDAHVNYIALGRSMDEAGNEARLRDLWGEATGGNL